MDYLNSLKVILLFGGVGFFLNRFARAKGFFKWVSAPSIPLSLTSVAVVFAIYLGATLLLAPMCFNALSLFYKARGESLSVLAVSLLQLCILLTIAVFFLIFSLTLPKHQMQCILKDPVKKSSLPFDASMGVIGWCLSIPLVMAVGELADSIVYFFSNVENIDQVAVRYLKTALSSKGELSIALFTIIIAAPCIEEFLFRGFLQNYLKKCWGPKVAILLTSLCFALFHLAKAQGLGNISLVLSLWVFALFLGFVYERQSSLVASITMHVLFNTVSSLRVLFSV